MTDINLTVNGELKKIKDPGSKPLLWTVREDLELTGSKFGCGYGLCGACTMLIDGKATRTCVRSTGGLSDKKITTIEGLDTKVGLALKEAWESIQVPQCGYCQPGMIMACASAIDSSPSLDLEEVLSKVSNICRCGTYQEIRTAIEKTLQKLKAGV